MPCRAVAAAGCGRRRGWQSSFQLSSPLPPAFFTQMKDQILSPPRTSVLLWSLGEGTSHPQPQSIALNWSRCSGIGFDLLADPSPLGRAEPRAGRARLCRYRLYLTALMQLNSHYSQLGKLHSCDARSSEEAVSQQG